MPMCKDGLEADEQQAVKSNILMYTGEVIQWVELAYWDVQYKEVFWD